MSNTTAQLEQILGYKFQDIAWLERAVTHRSWAHEKVPFGSEVEIRSLQNESMEFVGDAVLGMAVVEYLFNKFPDASEGELTMMKHRLVSTETLAKNSQRLNLGSFLRIGKGEEKTGGRKKLAIQADLVEAVIAAVFFDSGYISARAFVIRILAEDLRDVTPTSSMDYKTMLQERLHIGKHSPPKYQTVKTEGPPHNRSFVVEVEWDGGQVSGHGSSIKAAEMAAAHQALKKLGS